MEKVRLRTSANMADRSRTSSSENDLQILRISYVNTRSKNGNFTYRRE